MRFRPRLHRRTKAADATVEMCPADWELHHSCSDGHGHAVCPWCEQDVDVVDVRAGIVRLRPHALEMPSP